MKPEANLIHWRSERSWNDVDRRIDAAGILLLAVDRGEMTEPLSEGLRQTLSNMTKDAETARRFRRKLELVFTGYDDDPRELWDIPEVREYVSRLDAFFPYWFYFCYAEGQTLNLLLYCLSCLEPAGGHSTGRRVSRVGEINFFTNHFRAVNELFRRLNLPREENTETSREIAKYFGLEA